MSQSVNGSSPTPEDDTWLAQWQRQQRWTLCVQAYVQGRRSLRSFELKLGERALKLISYRSDGALEVYQADSNGLELFQGYLGDVMAAVVTKG